MSDRSTPRHEAHAPFAIAAQRWFDGESMQGPSVVEIDRGRIAAVHSPDRSPAGLPVTHLPGDAVLAPGFIDIQVNGGGGVLLNDAPSEATIRTIAAAHRRFGTTGLLPTLITDHPDKLEELRACAPASLAIPGVLGFHLEGPFLNPRRKGIHPPEHLRPFEQQDLTRLGTFGGIGSSLVTLAPEVLPPGTVPLLRAHGLRIAIGHSEASAAEVFDAVNGGASGVTHLFNAMAPMSAREPGVSGAALASDALFAGIICDGLHVAPAMLQAAFRCKGRDRLMLVTDAMPLVGDDATSFLLHGRRITLSLGQLTDDAGTLAGAHLTMFDAVRNAVLMMQIPLADALRMASATPAAFLGLDGELGHVKPGYRASLVAVSPAKVVAVWVDGVGGPSSLD
jgi:N-acetylglucosamine-6-phosphate deacetylase